jgi:hypothetical protein
MKKLVLAVMLLIGGIAVGGRYVWHAGYWSRPPYAGAHWVGPRHDGHYYHEGYWDGPHGKVFHDHASDKGHDRDFRHEDRH